jgi:hypothetical protein
MMANSAKHDHSSYCNRLKDLAQVLVLKFVETSLDGVALDFELISDGTCITFIYMVSTYFMLEKSIRLLNHCSDKTYVCFLCISSIIYTCLLHSKTFRAMI